MTKPNNGDKITLLGAHGDTKLIQATITDVNQCGISFERVDTKGTGDRTLSDEGTRWVRGWGAKAEATLRNVEKMTELNRKRDEQKRRQAEDARRAKKWIERFHYAAKVVKQAKLPKEFRGPAFSLVVCSPWGGA